MVGCDGLFLIGVYPESFGVYFLLINPHDTDTLVYVSHSAYIEDGKSKYYLSSDAAQPLSLYPSCEYLAPHDTIDFFLIFEKFPLDADSLNFWFKPGKGILGVKFEKEE